MFKTLLLFCYSIIGDLSPICQLRFSVGKLAFNKRDFEEHILDRISSYSNVQAIMPRDSQKEPGLQFVDNLCNIIRLNKSGTDQYNFYEYIKEWIVEV